MQQGCPQPHEEVPNALETLLLESASYINDTAQTIGVNLALFADDTSRYATERKGGYVIRNLQRGLNSMAALCERWNSKINENLLL
jgi:hypothetical protein